MAINPLLPPLRSRKPSVPPVVQHGRWESANDHQLLIRLAESMTDGVTGLNLSQVTSMPDPWGQVIAFLTAWMDGSVDNPLRRTIVSEWRGLIGLIALTGWRNLPIRRQELNLRDLSENAFRDEQLNNDAARKKQGIPHLGRVLRRAMPYDPRLLKGSDRLSIFCVSPPNGGAEVPIGLSLPLTLLVPARNYRNALPDEVTWAAMPEHYPLTDPALDDKLTPDERALIAAYVTKLKTLTPRFPTPISRYASVLNGELAAFHSDLTDELPKPLLVPRWTEQVFGATKDDSYHEDLLTIPDRSIGAGPGETLLKARPEFARAGFYGVLLSGGDKNQLAPGKDERSVKIWDEFCLSHWDHATDRARMIDQAAEAGYLLLDAGDLLSRQLVELDQAVLHHRRRNRSFLLPVNPVLLTVYSANELEDRLTIERLDRRRFKATLTLDFNREDGETVEIFISRDYSQDHSIKQLEAPSYCALWPDFKSDYWSHYYVELSTVDNGLHLGVSGASPSAITCGVYNPHALAQRLEEMSDRRNKISLVARLARGDFPGVRLLNPGQLPPRGRGDNFRLLTDRAPEALYLRDTTGEHGGLLLTFSAEEQPLVPNDQRWRVAVDYGSSSIAVRMRSQVEPESHAVNLGGMTRQLLGDPALELEIGPARLPLAPEDTFPIGDEIEPQLTLLWDKQSRSQSPNRDDLVLQRYYVPDRTNTIKIWEQWVGSRTNRQAGVSADGFHFGMKYSLNDANGDRVRELISRFVRQIALQAGARVVKSGARPDNVEWTTAYSDTMGKAERERFLNAIQEGISSVFVSPFTPVPPRTDCPALPESLCIGHYLRSGGSRKPFADADLAIAFDVGGYTTDVSIWQHGQPVWIGAMALAGQHLLTDYLLHHPAAAEQLEPQRGKDLKNVAAFLGQATGSVISAADTRGRLAAEIIINRDEFALAVEGRGIGRYTSNAAVVPFRHITQFAFSGLLYYIAILIRTLARQDIIESSLFIHGASPGDSGEAGASSAPGNGAGEKRIFLHFGGRGSRIFRHFMDSTAHDTALVDFAAAAHLHASVAPPAFTHQEKQEVAIGLLSDMRALDLSKLNRDRLLPQGVITQSGSTILGPGETLYPSPDQDFTLDRNLEGFANFLRAFQKSWDHGPDFLHRDWSDFVDKVADEFQVEKSRARSGILSASQLGYKSVGESVPIQPAFIVALRVAIREWIAQKKH